MCSKTAENVVLLFYHVIRLIVLSLACIVCVTILTIRYTMFFKFNAFKIYRRFFFVLIEYVNLF